MTAIEDEKFWVQATTGISDLETIEVELTNLRMFAMEGDTEASDGQLEMLNKAIHHVQEALWCMYDMPEE